MPLLFLGVGTVFLLTGIQGDSAKLWTLVKGDFTGQNNFIYWSVSILLLGSLGYIKALQPLSRVFVVLVLVVLFLDNKGFFAQLQQFINSNSTSSTASTSTSAGS